MMGLEQRLDKDIYIGAIYNHNNVYGNIEIYKDDCRIPIELSKVTNITENIHQWHNEYFIDELLKDYSHDETKEERYDINAEQLHKHLTDVLYMEEVTPEDIVDYFCLRVNIGSKEDGDYWGDHLLEKIIELKDILTEYLNSESALYSQLIYYTF